MSTPRAPTLRSARFVLDAAAGGRGPSARAVQSFSGSGQIVACAWRSHRTAERSEAAHDLCLQSDGDGRATRKRCRPAIWYRWSSPDEQPATPACIAIERHHRVGIHDISEPLDGHILPAQEHVEALIDFVRAWRPDEAPLLIHCVAGISRSMAAALITLVVKAPGRELEAARHVRERGGACLPEPAHDRARRSAARLRGPADRKRAKRWARPISCRSRRWSRLPLLPLSRARSCRTARLRSRQHRAPVAAGLTIAPGALCWRGGRSRAGEARACRSPRSRPFSSTSSPICSGCTCTPTRACVGLGEAFFGPNAAVAYIHEIGGAAPARARTRSRSTGTRARCSTPTSASPAAAPRCAACPRSTSRSGTSSARRPTSRSISCWAACRARRSASTTPAPAIATCARTSVS